MLDITIYYTNTFPLSLVTSLNRRSTCTCTWLLRSLKRLFNFHTAERLITDLLLLLLLLQEDESWLGELKGKSEKINICIYEKKNCVFICILKYTYERPFSLDNNYSHVQAPYRGVFSVSEITTGAIHSTKIQTGPTEKRGPPQKVDPFFRNFSGWTEPIHWVLDRNFRKLWLNGSRPTFRLHSIF